MKLTEETYRDACDSYSGYCRTCDDITQDSGVEPDARGYACPSCGRKTLTGIEEALMAGRITIEER